MASNYLSRLSSEEREKLIKQLWNIQNGKCFISEEEIDLILHSNRFVQYFSWWRVAGKYHYAPLAPLHYVLTRVGFHHYNEVIFQNGTVI